MFITLLWYCCTCNALRAATQVCHTTCSSSSFLTAATVSFTPLRSFLPTFRFITPCSQLCICFKAGHPFCPGTNQCTWNAPAFPQASPTILTGFHFAALRHTFTSVAFSPPAAHNWLALRTHFGCVHLADANCSCRTSISQSTAKFHLLSSAASVPWREIYCGGFLSRQHRCQPLSLASFTLARKGAVTLLLPPHGCSQALPFVPLSSALWRLATYATVWSSVPHGLASFLPQALLPFANAQETFPQLASV